MLELLNYGFTQTAKKIPGGIGQADKGGPHRAGVVVYFPVDDIEATLAGVEKNGGRCVVQPWELPGYGRNGGFHRSGQGVRKMANGSMKLDAIEVITLFVPNLAEVRVFYLRVFDAPIVCEDVVSVVFGFVGMMVNVLEQSGAPELVTPRTIGTAADGPRMLLTIKVDDVDAECSRLRNKGVAFLYGPIDRPWGRRTAAFADPGGIIWELAQEIEAP